MNRLRQSDVKALYHDLRTKSDEKDVEGAWRSIFKSYFVERNPDGNAKISSPSKVDGFIFEDRMIFALRILLEFKDGTDLQKAYDRARIAIQCIYYMKQFEKKGIDLPNVIVGADEDQAFVLYAPNFYKYLKSDTTNWSIAPSSAYKANPELMNLLINDSNLSVFIYDLNSGKGIKQQYATIKDLFDEVESLAGYDPKTGEEFKVNVNESNLAVLFDEFIRITFNSLKELDSVFPVDMVNIFQQLLLGRNPDEYYPLPSDPNKLHLPGDKKIAINGANMNAFFKHFNRNLSIEEQNSLIAISDRLIEDITRRRKGDYWTPTIWANKAISLLDTTLNGKWKTKTAGLIEDWKKDCVVWDCAAGAKNLTRDYQFKHLYSSTIHQSELDLSKQYNAYPTSNYAFQYDFLNDDIDQLSLLQKSNDLRHLTEDDIKSISSHLKMPENLFRDLLANKPLVVYINPPFGTANSRSFTSEHATKKAKMAKTEVNALMKEAKMGRASQQLYAQFFFRIVNLINLFQLDNVILAAFSPYQFRVGGNYYGNFYNYFLQTLHPFRGYLFNAGEFSDVASDWAITFSLYSNEGTFPRSEQVETCEFQKDSIKSIFNKTIRTVDEQNSLSSWVKGSHQKQYLGKKLNANEFTAVTSAVKSSKPSIRTSYYENAIGYMYFIGNDVEHSDTAVSLFSSSFKSGNGICITKENIKRAVIGFSIRRCANFEWYSGKDAFYIDNSISEQILSDNEFLLNCLVFSLSQFRSSYQSSLGTNSVPTGYPTIENQWFFLPHNLVANLYGKAKVSDNNRALFSKEYSRAKTANNSLVVNLLENLGVSFELVNYTSHKTIIQPIFNNPENISEECQSMMKCLCNLFNITWPYRDLAINSHPEWSLERYDAGFNQLYKIATQIIENQQWIDEYKNSYDALRKSIHDYGQRLSIMSPES